MKAIIRVNFVTSTTANQAVNMALTGSQNGKGTEPFERVARSTFMADLDRRHVIQALGDLQQVIQDHADHLSYLSVTVVEPDDE